MRAAQAFCLILLLVLRGVPAAFGAHDEGRGGGYFSMNTGAYYSSGDYGEAVDTEILYLPLGLTYERDMWLLRLTVPYIQIDGPAGVVVGPDGVIVPGTGTTRRKEEGLGDIVASATYTLFPRSASMPFIDLTAKIKFGTADENKDLGTGANDYSFQVDVSKSFGRLGPFATLGYRRVGDARDFDLNNTWYGSVGAAYRFKPNLSGGLIFDIRQAASETSEGPRELTPYFVWRLDPTWSLTGYGVAGFSTGSPDAAVGLQIYYYPPR